MSNKPRYYYPLPKKSNPETIETDLCIYGGTCAGVVAAVQASRLGVKVVLVEFGLHLGGLSSGGLGATDIGNKGAIGGISREFYRRLGKHYGKPEMWTFEPSVAEKTFNEMIAEAKVPVYFEERLESVKAEKGGIKALVMESGDVFRAKVFIDATYEGDLMARAGVSYHVGRESNATYNEMWNGIQVQHTHNFLRFVDPYVVPGKPESGLLKGISPEPLGVIGDGDNKVQAYNFRLCMTNVKENQVPFPKPEGYDPERYELFLRHLNTGVWDALNLKHVHMMPNGKTDTNNNGAFSSDNIGMNYGWPDGTYEEREAIFQDHVNYHQGMLWFLANDPRVPKDVQEDVRKWGLPKDEYMGTSNWTHQLYIREARRMISDYVMTEHDCVGRYQTVEDGIALAAYTMDSHNCQRIVRGGRVCNEGDVQVGGFTPYPISYRSIRPRKTECKNLLVPVCLSASHIAFGSIRMEPVFMILGQVAASAAALALEKDCAVQDIDVKKLQKQVRADKQPISWPAEENDPVINPESVNLHAK